MSSALPSAPSPSPARALARLGRRIGCPDPAAWAPPPLPVLIDRIDAALAKRRHEQG